MNTYFIVATVEADNEDDAIADTFRGTSIDPPSEAPTVTAMRSRIIMTLLKEGVDIGYMGTIELANRLMETVTLGNFSAKETER